MEQNTVALNSDEMSVMLKKALINQSLVQNDVIEEIIKQRDAALDEARKSIQGTCYSIDYKHKKLRVFDTYTNNDISLIDLPGKPGKFDPEDFDTWGTSTVIVNLEELQKEGDIPFHKEANYGLAVRGNKSYLHNPEIEKQNLLALTNQYIFGGRPKNKHSNLPFDMYLSNDNKLLCLSNRDEGNVYLFDTTSNTFIDEINVRQAGSSKTINLAISPKNKKIYITDNTSPVVTVYETDTKKITKKSLNSGVLGNICLTPDEKTFYVVIIKPEANLKAFSVDEFKELKSFTPKGEYFSNGDDPCDLLTLSSDEKYIFSMTYLNDPMPFTPVLTVIDLEKNKAVKRFSIKDETKPIIIAFREENPLGGVNKTLEELLVEKGLFTFNKLRDIKLSIMRGDSDQDEKSEEVKKQEEEKEGFIHVESQNLAIEKIKEEPQSIDLGFAPRKVKHVILPKTANKHIIEILLGNFWQRNEVDLSEIPDAYKKLEELADRTRKKLEYYDIEIIKLKNFFENYGLDTTIQRQFILEMVDEEESSKRQEVKSAPSNCVNCGSPMLGLWECMACGFSYEKPEDALRRKNASLDPLANLNKGNYFALDNQKGFLMEVDNYKIPIWELKKEELDLKSITELVRLDNRNTLVLDGEANSIIELTPKGAITWKYNPSSEESILNNPKGFSVLSNNDLLIADTDNHRVMEMDFDGTIIWQYGVKGAAGTEFNTLNQPTSIQKTYDGNYLISDTGNNRLVEISRELDTESGIYKIKKIWQYGNVENILGKGEGREQNQLNQPTMAFRNIDGDVMILDQGNQRVIEIDHNNDLKWQYKTVSSEPQINIENPTRCTKLKNKDLLIIGDDKMVQVLISKNEEKVIWFSSFEELSDKTTFRVTRNGVTKTKAKYGKSSRYSGKFDEESNTVKKKREEKKQSSSNHYMKTAEELKPKEVAEIPEELEVTENSIEEIKQDKKIDNEKPRIVLTKNEKVISLPILILDKIEKMIHIANREGKIIWSYGEHNPLNQLKSAEITPNKTLIICEGNSVFELDMVSKEEIYTHTVNANSAFYLANDNILITDETNNKVYEISKDNQISWEYYSEKPPSYAIRLSNGNTLITYAQSHIVKEMDNDYNIVWSFGEENKPGNDNNHLASPEHAIRLKNGHTLITDSKNGRVIEVSIEGEIVWSYSGSSMTKLITPNFAHRLKDGHTYVMHTNYRQIIEIDLESKVIWRLIMPSKKL